MLKMPLVPMAMTTNWFFMSKWIIFSTSFLQNFESKYVINMSIHFFQRQNNFIVCTWLFNTQKFHREQIWVKKTKYKRLKEIYSTPKVLTSMHITLVNQSFWGLKKIFGSASAYRNQLKYKSNVHGFVLFCFKENSCLNYLQMLFPLCFPLSFVYFIYFTYLLKSETRSLKNVMHLRCKWFPKKNFRRSHHTHN